MNDSLLQTIKSGPYKHVCYIASSLATAVEECAYLENELREENNQVCLTPRGVLQNMSGLLCKGLRPDLIVMEDCSSFFTEDKLDQVEKARKWFEQDVSQCLDHRVGHAEILFTDDLGHLL